MLPKRCETSCKRDDFDHNHQLAAALCTKCVDPANPTKAKKNAKSVNYVLKSTTFEAANSHMHWELQRMRSLASRAADTKKSSDIQVLRKSPTGGLVPRARRLSMNRAHMVRMQILGEGGLPKRIEDLYDLQGAEKLGSGSYGAVSKIKDYQDGQYRALKVIQKDKITNIVRLKREILVMKKLDHPNIVRLFEVFEDNQNLYFVIELCTGGELFEAIVKAGTFDERTASVVARQLFSAIAYCHDSDIIHRDLKPENVMYANTSRRSHIKVIDWGFSAKCSMTHKFNSVVGTPYYVAPEVLHGSYDYLCDMWSIGVMIYVMLVGYPPFHGKDNKEILRKVKLGEYQFNPRHWSVVSEHAKDLVRRLLMYDPRRRLTATRALKHGWLTYFVNKNQTRITTAIGQSLIRRFQRFEKATRLKQLALNAIAYNLSDRELGGLHGLFVALDRRSEGKLTIRDFEVALEQINIPFSSEIRSTLEAIDTDGSGYIDYTEFMAASIDGKICQEENLIRKAFRVFDSDNKGSIHKSALREMLVTTVRDVDGEVVGGLVDEMLATFQHERKEEVTFDEFVTMMKTQSHICRDYKDGFVENCSYPQTR